MNYSIHILWIQNCRRRAAMNTNDTFTNRPVTMNEKNNLLEIEEHMYILYDVKKPNVFRNMFPYS